MTFPAAKQSKATQALRGRAMRGCSSRRMERAHRIATADVAHWLFCARQRSIAAALVFVALVVALAAGRAAAGQSDNEIRIGNTLPYTGPAAAYGIIGKIISAYFDKINADGGVKGRRIKFISYDDAYNPAKALELTRKLVEEDKVLLTFAGFGTDTAAAAQPYLHSNRIPHLFINSGAAMWDRPRESPWTTGFLPTYQTEGH